MAQRPSCLFGRDYRNNGNNPKTVLGSSAVRKLSEIETRRKEQGSLFRRGDYRNSVNNPRKCPGF
jgi:hypothetical protein